MPFVLPRSREGRKERGNERERKRERKTNAKRRRVSELTAVSVSLSRGGGPSFVSLRGL